MLQLLAIADCSIKITTSSGGLLRVELDLFIIREPCNNKSELCIIARVKTVLMTKIHKPSKINFCIINSINNDTVWDNDNYYYTFH